MAAKQRLQELELFETLGPILLSIAPRWHAITDTVRTLDSFFPLFCRLILNLTFLPAPLYLGACRHPHECVPAACVREDYREMYL